MTTPDKKIIGTLETGKFLITIKASPQGPLYSIADKNDTPIATDLTEAQLKKSHIELYRLITTMHAGNDDTLA